MQMETRRPLHNLLHGGDVLATLGQTGPFKIPLSCVGAIAAYNKYVAETVSSSYNEGES